LTLREAETTIRAALRSFVRGKGLLFTLQRPRRFRVPVLGEVERPGAVTLQAPARAADAIDAAGGGLRPGAHRGVGGRRGARWPRPDLLPHPRGGTASA